MSMRMNRRRFLGKAATAAATLAFPYIVPSKVFGRGGVVAPSEKIVMACIGVGDMGGGHLRSFLGQDDVQMVAICDVFGNRRDRAVETVNRRYANNDCTGYRDFRELLARDDIDAVCIATPDHWHALIGIEAARNGKDMYYEKPLAMSIAECKAIRQAVNQYGVVFQFGTQQRSESWFRFTVELVRNERIGKLHTIMVGSAKYGQVPNQPAQPVPPDLDYDMWLGPAQYAPYTRLRCTRNWTLISDYSLGCLGGAWGIHHVDIAQWAANADNTGPLDAAGWGEFPAEGLYDTAQHWEIEHNYANGIKMIHMDMDTAKTKMPQFSLHWMGILFLGSDGWIYTARGFFASEPKDLLREKLGANDIRLAFSNNHRRNFLDCVRTRQQTVCPVDTAVRSDTVTHLDHIAMVLGRKLHWDPVKETFINDNEANRMLSRPMRSPWRL